MATCNTCKANKVCDHNKYGFENCNNYIPEDVVEVVRCKDCIYCDLDGRCEAPENGLIREYVNPDDFCSYGERKDT